MSKKGVSLTEILIALAVGIAILIPTTAMFSTSSKMLEKSSNLTFASGLARYIIQGMMSAPLMSIVDVPIPGISCCDDSDDNVYFRNLFNLKRDVGNLKEGRVYNTLEGNPKFFSRCAKYDFRYSISVGEASPNDVPGDIVKSVSVLITWKEFGVDKVYKAHVYIVPR